MKKLLLVAVFAAFASSATAIEMAGVNVPDSAEVAGQTLTLNGAGLREKAWIDVYVGALYLPEESSEAAEIIESQGPSRMLMHFVRDVPADKIVDAWKEGFANNNSQELHDAVAERVERFNGFFTADLKENDAVVLDYVPGEGTRVVVAGEDKGVIEGKDFATALRAVWLGPKPPTKKFQRGLLGK